MGTKHIEIFTKNGWIQHEHHEQLQHYIQMPREDKKERKEVHTKIYNVCVQHFFAFFFDLSGHQSW